MKYREVIRFISDCLALSVCTKSKDRLQSYIESGQIDWNKIVQVSSIHLVLPALYVQLKRSSLLELLPQDLQDYMSEITSLNRIRNQQNIEEVRALNNLFRAHQIQVIFLKGSAHLIEGLYSDIAERMVGDIDLLVDPEKMELAAEILIDKGYVPMSVYSSENFERTKHYPRMIHQDKVFAVEIHKDVIQKKTDRQLDFRRINSSKRKVGGCYLPSYEDLILHNMLNTQLNDQGFLCMNINLRQKYDLLLLSQKEKPSEVIRKFNFHKLKTVGYLVKSANIFKGVTSLDYPRTIWAYWVEVLVHLKLSYPLLMSRVSKVNFLLFRIVRDMRLAIEFLPDKNNRNRILKYLRYTKHRKIYFQNIFERVRSM